MLLRLPIPSGDPYAVNTEAVMSTIRTYAARHFASFPLLAALALAPAAWAQSTPQSQQPPAQPPHQTAPAPGGPTGDNVSIAMPKKKDKPDDPPPPALPQPKFKNPEGAGDYS